MQLNFGGDRQALNAIYFVTRVWGPVSMMPLIKSSSVFYSDGLRLGFIQNFHKFNQVLKIFQMAKDSETSQKMAPSRG